MQLLDSSTYRGGESAGINFNVAPNPVRLTAKLSSGSVTYGAKVTLSGTLTYQRNDTGSYVPFASPMKVSVYNAGSSKPNTAVATVQTAANGSYSVTLPKTTGTVWRVQFSPASALLQGRALRPH